MRQIDKLCEKLDFIKQHEVSFDGSLETIDEAISFLRAGQGKEPCLIFKDAAIAILGGEITMAGKMVSMIPEIEAVPIEPLAAFLAEAGLIPGVTAKTVKILWKNGIHESDFSFESLKKEWAVILRDFMKEEDRKDESIDGDSVFSEIGAPEGV